MTRVALSARVHITATGETTTIAALAAQGRIRWSTCLMTGPKRNGERKETRRYFADLIDPSLPDDMSTGWEIGETAYRTRTGAALPFNRDTAE